MDGGIEKSWQSTSTDTCTWVHNTFVHVQHEPACNRLSTISNQARSTQRPFALAASTKQSKTSDRGTPWN